MLGVILLLGLVMLLLSGLPTWACSRIGELWPAALGRENQVLLVPALPSNYPAQAFTRGFTLTSVLLAVLSLGSSKADAGHMDGPASEVVTLAPYQTVTFDVPYFAWEPAIISAFSYNSSNLELYIYDGDGHMWRGDGFGDRRTAVIGNVYRAGYFRIEVRNPGPVSSPILISSN